MLFLFENFKLSGSHLAKSLVCPFKGLTSDLTCSQFLKRCVNIKEYV